MFHPTFLYEILWNLLGIVVLLAIERKWRRSTDVRRTARRVPGRRDRLAMQWGRMLGLYLIWYGLGRSYLESIRIDPSEIFFGIRTNIWAAFAAILLGTSSSSSRDAGTPARAEPVPAGHEWRPELLYTLRTTIRTRIRRRWRRSLEHHRDANITGQHPAARRWQKLPRYPVC